MPMVMNFERSIISSEMTLLHIMVGAFFFAKEHNSSVSFNDSRVGMTIKDSMLWVKRHMSSCAELKEDSAAGYPASRIECIRCIRFDMLSDAMSIMGILLPFTSQ